MTYTIKLEQQDFAIFSGDKATCKVIVSWDTGDTALTSQASMKLTPKPTTGSVKNSDGSPPLKDSKFPVINTAARTATFSFPLLGDTAGDVSLTPSVTTPPLPNTNDLVIHVLPADTAFVMTGWDRQAIHTHTDDTLTPTVATADKKAVLTVTAKTAAGNPVEFAPVNVLINNFNISDTAQGGKIFDSKGNQITTKSSGPNNATTDISTDAQGKVTMTVVSTTHPAFLDCSISAGKRNLGNQRLYLFDDSADKSLNSLSLPLAQLPDGSYDLDQVTGEKFSALIGSSIPKNEYVALILNGEFQSERSGTTISETPFSLNANKADLKSGTSLPENNKLFYAVSNSGGLINSLFMQFNVTNNTSPVGPLPKNPFVGPFIKPTGGVFNLETLKQDVPFIIPLAADQTKLQSKGIAPLTTTNAIRLFFNLTGDNPDAGGFVTTPLFEDFPITDAAAQQQTISMDPNAFINYGDGPEPGQKGTYTFWYAYIQSTTDETRIAESFTVTGKLATRAP